MNNYLKYICLGVTCMGLSSCDSWFDGMLDDELPKHDLVPENAIVDEKSSEKALLGAYSFLDDSQYNSGYLNSHLVTINWHRLNMIGPTAGGSFDRDQVYKFQYDPTDTNYELPWSHVYKMMNAINNTITYTEQADDAKYGPDRKNEILAEARFLRGFLNMYLMEHYAQFYDLNSPYGVLLRMMPSALSNNNLARATVAQSYEAIYADLEFASTYAPAFSSVYRISRPAAKAFYANYLLMRGTDEDYKKALVLADEALASTDFAMEKNYADIFSKKQNSTELYFTQYTKAPFDYKSNVSGLLQLLGAGQWHAKKNEPEDDFSQYLVIMNDEETERYKATCDSVKFSSASSAKKTFVWKKHHSMEKVAMPMYYLRVAQMYLVKAEAMSYLPEYTIADVIGQLNVLHTRANEELLKAEDYATMEDARAEIFKEYVRETGSENGDAFFYAARTMVGGRRLIAQYNTWFTDDKTLCFPIPAKELEKNNLMVQNQY